MPTLEEYIKDTTSFPNDTSVKLADGVETTLGKLREGFMKDADYRSKTTKLANDKRSFDTERQEWEAARLEAEAKLNALAQQLLQKHPDATREEAEEMVETDPRIKRLTAKLDELNKKSEDYTTKLKELEDRNRLYEETYIADQHRRVLAHLKSLDKDLDTAELVEYARAHLIGRLDDAYKAFKFDKAVEESAKKAEEAGVKKGYEKAKAELMQPVIRPHRVIQSNPEAPADMEAARDAALQDPDIIRTMMGEGQAF